MKKRVLSIMLAIIMVLGTIPFSGLTAFAASSDFAIGIDSGSGISGLQALGSSAVTDAPDYTIDLPEGTQFVDFKLPFKSVTEYTLNNIVVPDGYFALTAVYGDGSTDTYYRAENEEGTGYCWYDDWYDEVGYYDISDYSYFIFSKYDLSNITVTLKNPDGETPITDYEFTVDPSEEIDERLLFPTEPGNYTYFYSGESEKNINDIFRLGELSDKVYFDVFTSEEYDTPVLLDSGFAPNDDSAIELDEVIPHDTLFVIHIHNWELDEEAHKCTTFSSRESGLLHCCPSYQNVAVSENYGFTEHTFSGYPLKCTACGYEYHAHSVSENYMHNGVAHWHTCDDEKCPFNGKTDEKTIANYLKGFANGEKGAELKKTLGYSRHTGMEDYICDACGYEDLSKGASEFTFCDGTEKDGYLPIYGYYCDAYTRSQMIYPAEMLEDMIGFTFERMTFYAASQNASWGNDVFKVYLQTVEQSDMSGGQIISTNGAENVYEGKLIVADGKLQVDLNAPYTYNGGNLLVTFDTVVKGTYYPCDFYGTANQAGGIENYSYNGVPTSGGGIVRNILPKITFAAKKVVSVGELEYGELTVDSYEAYPGDTVTVIPVLPETDSEYGYSLVPGSLKVTYEGGTVTPELADDGTYKFKMPEKDVTVTAESEQLPSYTVTVNDVAHGTLTADCKYAVAGQKVTVTAAPESGDYILTARYLECSDGENSYAFKDIGGGKFVFIMPAKDVAVSADFIEFKWNDIKKVLAGETTDSAPGYYEVSVNDGVTTIKLLADLMLNKEHKDNSELIVPKTQNVVIDLNGFDIDANNLRRIFTIEGGKLTVTDSTAKTVGDEYVSGCIKNGYADSSLYGYYFGGGGGIAIHGGGTLIMNGGILCDCTANMYNSSWISQAGNGGGGAIFVGDGYIANHNAPASEFILNDGVIRNCTAINAPYVKCGGVIVYANSKFTMNGGVITECSCQNAGAVYINGGYDRNAFWDGIFIMNGGKITNNRAEFMSGGVTLQDMVTVVINGGEISENISNENGGGIYSICYTELQINGGDIINNTAGENGGGVYSDNCHTIITGGNIKGNKAKKGAGVYCVSPLEPDNTICPIPDGDLVIYGGIISDNIAAQKGGGIYTGDTHILFGKNAVVKDNYLVTGKDSKVKCDVEGKNYVLADGENAPTEDMCIGLYGADIAVENASSGDKAYFFADDNENYVVKFDGNDKKIILDPAAASVNGIGYETFAEAVAAVENGGTIKLLDDNAETATVTAPMTFTVNGNGSSFTGEIKVSEGLSVQEKNGTYIIKVAHTHAKSEIYMCNADAHWFACNGDNCAFIGADDAETLANYEALFANPETGKSFKELYGYEQHIGMDDYICDACGYCAPGASFDIAKAAAKANLEKLKEISVSDEAKAAVDTAIANVEKAETKEAVENAEKDGKDNASAADKSFTKAVSDAKSALDAENAKDPLIDKTPVTEGKNNIDKKTSLLTVESAKSTAVGNIQSAQATELANAKKDAKAALDAENAKAPLADNSSVTAGKQNIDESATKAEVKSAKKEAVKKIQAAQAAELANAKNTANNALDAENAKDPLIDNSPVATGKQNINNSTTKDTVDSAKDAALKNIRAVQAKELADARKDAKNIIREENSKDPLLNMTALREGEQRIEDAINKSAVSGAKTDALNNIKAAQAKELADAKNDAAKALDEENAADPLIDESALTQAKQNIENAANKVAVASEKAKGEDNVRKAQASEIAQAKASANSALAELKKNVVSDEAKAEIEAASGKINKATNKAAVASAKQAGIDNADAAEKELAKAISDAKSELEALKAESIADDAKSAIDTAIGIVEKTVNLDAVANAKKLGKNNAAEAEKILADVKAEAIKALEALASEAPSDEIANLVREAANSINSATNAGSVDAAKETGLENVDRKQRVEGFGVPETYFKLGYREVTPINAVSDTNRIIYTSSDENVVTVDENGNITAVGQGTCTITVSLEGTDISKDIEVEVSYSTWDVIVWHIRNFFQLVADFFRKIFSL